MLKLQIVVAKYLVPASVLNFMAAWIQAAAVPNIQSILGIAAIVNALLSFGLLGGALTLAYGYGGLNNEVKNLTKKQIDDAAKIESFINRLEESNERRNTRLWDELKKLNDSVGVLKGQDEFLNRLANRGISIPVTKFDG